MHAYMQTTNSHTHLFCFCFTLCRSCVLPQPFHGIPDYSHLASRNSFNPIPEVLFGNFPFYRFNDAPYCSFASRIIARLFLWLALKNARLTPCISCDVKGFPLAVFPTVFLCFHLNHVCIVQAIHVLTSKKYL